MININSNYENNIKNILKFDGKNLIKRRIFTKKEIIL